MAANLLSDPVSFIASIPPIETAIKIHGDEGARLVLDVADSELGNFFPITLMRGKVLRVTAEVLKSARAPCSRSADPIDSGGSYDLDEIIEWAELVSRAETEAAGTSSGDKALCVARAIVKAVKQYRPSKG